MSMALLGPEGPPRSGKLATPLMKPLMSVKKRDEPPHSAQAAPSAETPLVFAIRAAVNSAVALSFFAQGTARMLPGKCPDCSFGDREVYPRKQSSAALFSRTFSSFSGSGGG